MDKNKSKSYSVFLILFALLIGLLLFNLTLIIKSEIKYESIGIKMSDDVPIPCWRTTWGGPAQDFAEGVAVDLAGNIYITGYTYSIGEGDWDAFLVKYDSSGTRLWNTTWGGSEYDHGNGVATDLEDNIYIVGATSNFGAGNVDAFLVKYNASGTQLWNTTWGKSQNDYAYGLAVDQAGNVYISGITTHTNDPSLAEQFVAKYYTNGTLQWSEVGLSYYNECGNGIAIDSLGNIYITGTSEQPALYGDEQKVFLEKYTPSGTRLWFKFWDDYNYQIGKALAVDSYDNIYTTGVSGGSLFLQKYNSSGTQLWNLTYSAYYCGCGISVDSMDKIYITGIKNIFTEGFLIKCNSSGTKLLDASWPNYYNDNPIGTTVDSDDNIYIVGTDTIYGDVFAIKNPNIPNEHPLSNKPPSPITIYTNSIATINWILTDDVSPGLYGVEVVGIDGTSYTNYEGDFFWTNGTTISYPINTISVGTFNYSIYYIDSIGWSGTPSTVTVKVVAPPTSPTIANTPEFFVIWSIFATLSLIVYTKRLKNYSHNN